MKAVCFVSFAAALFISLQIQAQTRSPRQNQNSGKSAPQKESAPPKETMSQAADSIKFAINDAKTSFHTLFKGHKDTTTITISGIDYDDPGLSSLKESLKKARGVKQFSMEYKSSTAILKVPFKGTPTALWDEVDASAKTPFKIVEAGDNDLVLKYRNAAVTQ